MWAVEEVGRRIGKLRNDRSLSREQFGKLIGLSTQYVGRIERGNHCITGAVIARICEAMEVSADYIVFGVDTPIIADALHGLSWIQIEIAMDLLRRLANLVYTERGNNALIQEVLRQQHPYADHTPKQ